VGPGIVPPGRWSQIAAPLSALGSFSALGSLAFCVSVFLSGGNFPIGGKLTTK
jgi:hypothetical protein